MSNLEFSVHSMKIWCRDLAWLTIRGNLDIVEIHNFLWNIWSLINFIMFWLVWTFVSTKFLNLITNKSNIRRIFFICAYRKHCFGFRPVHFCTTLTSNYWIHTSYCGTKKRNSRTYCFIKNLICWPQSKTEAQLVLPPFHFHLHAIKGWLMPLRFAIQDRNLAPPN